MMMTTPAARPSVCHLTTEEKAQSGWCIQGIRFPCCFLFIGSVVGIYVGISKTQPKERDPECLACGPGRDFGPSPDVPLPAKARLRNFEYLRAG